jgi:hypothetical protein
MIVVRGYGELVSGINRVWVRVMVVLVVIVIVVSLRAG